jgi:transcriptional regulator with GAF, ATPase, and Fis domain
VTATPVLDMWLDARHATSEGARAVTSALRRDGARIATETATDDEGVPGVFLIEQSGQTAVDDLATATRRGRRRVLVLTLPGAEDVDHWALLASGASDVLAWRDPSCAAEAIARFTRWREVDDIIASPLVRENLVGTSPRWVQALREIIELGRFTSAPVLLTGESGTGKELAARLIHSLDPRPDKGDLVVLDCTTIVPTLSGSEFFGHQRGAFTGAVAARAGAFELADGGTLFLDEVGELPLPLQAELLRVIQEGTFKRVGSSDWLTTEFRLICATNKNLLEEQSRGTFRRDFYHRIAASTVTLPNVRERPDDIMPLADHFLGETDGGGHPMDEVIRDFLVQRDYPGNVRELRQLVARIGARHVGPGPITAGHVPKEERPVARTGWDRWVDEGFELAIARAVAAGVSLKEVGRAASDTAVRLALEAEDGNVGRAATRLGVTNRALQLRRARARRPLDEESSATPRLA